MFEQLTEALSIKFSHSEDGSQFDFQSSPDKEKYSLKVKCFRCFGTHQLNCQECHGTQMISFNHPMAKLLDEVLVRKLSLYRIEQDREEQLERVYPIKQEQQDCDEKKIICTFCDRQCQITSYRSKQCSDYTCSECTDKTSSHYLKNEQNIRIKDCQKNTLQPRYCKNCNNQLQNCYTLCKTCQSLNYNFWICGSCSDNHRYNHPKSHLLQTAVNFDINRSGRLESGSSIDIEQSCDNSETYRYNELLAQVDLIVFSRTQSITSDIRPEQPLNESIQINRKTLATSCVKLQTEGLFNSYDGKSQLKPVGTNNQTKINSQNLSQKKQLNNYVSNLKSSKGDKQNIFVQKGNEQKVDYIFDDYRCDRCGREPIVNIRYHCKQCEDFDVCQACYPVCKLHHQHCFQKIDGKMIRERAVQKLMESNLIPACNKLKRRGSCFEPLRQNFETVS